MTLLAFRCPRTLKRSTLVTTSIIPDAVVATFACSVSANGPLAVDILWYGSPYLSIRDLTYLYVTFT